MEQRLEVSRAHIRSNSYLFPFLFEIKDVRLQELLGSQRKASAKHLLKGIWKEQELGSG